MTISSRSEAHIVLGLGYGDEGKGKVVSYLCERLPDPLVVRFSGGHQCGHTVVRDGKRFVFSSFGSGTAQGVTTYWSSFCPVYPTGLLREYYALRERGLEPVLILDPLSPVVTPFDVLLNQLEAAGLTLNWQGHGSVGVGFGTTVRRNEETPYRLYVRDLPFLSVVRHKLDAIRWDWFTKQAQTTKNIPDAVRDHFAWFDDASSLEMVEDVFIDAVKQLAGLFRRWGDGGVSIQPHTGLPLASPGQQHRSLIFEGSQGILLDREAGFFPHVTRSFTTARNALRLLETSGLDVPVTTHYVSRSYATRHGMGPLSNEGIDAPYTPIVDETNVTNPWQGQLRTAALDEDMLRYAIHCNEAEYPDLMRLGNWTNVHLYLNCMDCVDRIPLVTKQGMTEIEPQDLARKLLDGTHAQVKSCSTSRTPESLFDPVFDSSRVEEYA